MGIIAGMSRTPRGINSINLILDHASRLFLSNGYRSTTVEQIARAANLSKGAVYFHFKDKAALALHLLQRAEEQLDTAIATASECDNPQDALVRFLHQRSLLAQQRPDYWLLTIMLSVELAGSRSLIETNVKKVYERLDNFLEELISDGVSLGLFTSELPAKEQAAIIVATHDGMLMQWRRRGRQLKGKHLVRAMRRSVLLGLGARLTDQEKSPAEAVPS
ncbi:MAG: TetR/AcrR family transcriptional regulator [Immundisolibacteraceae bacterium]|nr:TetR/AcrR family transcriptional regulator [Immundisolibacteraceae bacterium]